MQPPPWSTPYSELARGQLGIDTSPALAYIINIGLLDSSERLFEDPRRAKMTVSKCQLKRILLCVMKISTSV